MKHIFTIRQVIEQLYTFEDLDMKVALSFDDGDTLRPLNFLGKVDGYCALMSSETLFDKEILKPVRVRRKLHS